MISVIAALCFGLPSASSLAFPEKSIDLTARALPTRVVVEELAKQGGLKLKVEADMENEPLILRLNHVPLKEAMGKIAEVFAADWVDHGDYLRLERSADQIRQLREKSHALRIRQIKDSIQALMALDRENPALDAKGAEELVTGFARLAPRQGEQTKATSRESISLNSRLPTRRLGLAVIASMDPAALASLGLGRRVTFSTSKGPLSRSLPELDPAAVDAFVSGRALLAKACQRLGTDFTKPGFYDLHRDAEPIERPPAKVTVLASAELNRRDVNLYIQFFDADGGYITGDQETVGMDYNAVLASVDKLTELQQKATLAEIELDSVGKELAPHTGLSKRGEMRPLSKPAVDALLHPTERDPLGIASSQILLAAAVKEGVNTVCLAPDAVEFAALGSARAGKTSLEAFQALLYAVPLDFARRDGWLIVKPVDPLETAETRMPRELLQSFLQNVVREGRISLDALAALRASVPRECDVNWSIAAANWLLPDPSIPGGQLDLMRLFGSLSDDQRERATKQGLTLHYHELSEQQQESVRDYMEDHQIAYAEAGDTLIGVTDLSEPTVFGTYDLGQREFEQALPLDQIAMMLGQVEHPDLDIGTKDLRIAGFRFGTLRTVTFSFPASSKGGATDTLQESRKPQGPALPLAELLKVLPPATLAQIRQIEEEFVSKASPLRNPEQSPARIPPLFTESARSSRPLCH